METDGTFPNERLRHHAGALQPLQRGPLRGSVPGRAKGDAQERNGITIHNQERCIGCRACQKACPYSAQDVTTAKASYSVISFNVEEPHGDFRQTTAVIPGGTASGAEVAKRAGATPPHRTRYTHSDYADVRKKDVVEKCTFCEHRVVNGETVLCHLVPRRRAHLRGSSESAEPGEPASSRNSRASA